MDILNGCIYCQSPPDSLEHPLLAAFGEFAGAPSLKDRICSRCNNTRLGILDEQLARCGPEALLRRHYGVQGRSTNDPVNPFYRGSAGGHRLEMKSFDEKVGAEVLLECENGVYRQARQLIFIEESGRTHHLPIRDGTRPEQLRAAYQQLHVKKPFETRIMYGAEEKAWVERLIEETWPSAIHGDGAPGATTFQGAETEVVLTNRYFRAIAKMGFHYFLTQFPQYAGHEPIFSGIRDFILDESSKVGRANSFVGKRQIALLGEMLPPGTRPDGWRAHILCGETKPGECVAHVQLFLTEDWPAPTYTIGLARDSAVVDRLAAGHAYVYFQNGPQGRYAGEALSLGTTRADFVAPPLAPVVI